MENKFSGKQILCNIFPIKRQFKEQRSLRLCSDLENQLRETIISYNYLN
jgi:hypothetical protein